MTSQLSCRWFPEFAAHQKLPTLQYIKITTFDPVLSTIFSIFQTHFKCLRTQKMGIRGFRIQITS
jgi:hypothetical protein